MEHENESARETVEATTPVSELEAEFKRCFDLNDKSGMLEAHRKLLERLSQEKPGEMNSRQSEKPEDPAIPTPVAFERHRNVEANAFLNACVNAQKGSERVGRNTLSDFEVDSTVLAFKPRTSQQIFESTDDASGDDNLSKIYAHPYGLDEMRAGQGKGKSKSGALAKESAIETGHLPVIGADTKSDDTKAVIAAAREQAKRAREESKALELELEKKRALQRSEVLARQEHESESQNVVDEDAPGDRESNKSPVEDVVNDHGAKNASGEEVSNDHEAKNVSVEEVSNDHEAKNVSVEEVSNDHEAKDASGEEASNDHEAKNASVGQAIADRKTDEGVSTGDLFVPVALDIQSEVHHSSDEVKITQDFRPESKGFALGFSETQAGTPASILARLQLQPGRRTPQKTLEPIALLGQPISYYEILGVDRLASNKEVETAFLRRVRVLLERSSKDGLPVSKDLVTYFVARDVILDCLSREDHDFRVLSLKRSATENKADRSEDDRNAKKLEIAEALTMAGLLEPSEVDLALEMHLPNKGQLFADFLVENKMVEIEQLESALLGRSLVKDGRLKMNCLKRTFKAARSYAVDFVDGLLVSIDITPEEILELSRSLTLKTISEKISLKMFLLKPDEKAYVHAPPPPVEINQETTQRLQALLSFDKPDESP